VALSIRPQQEATAEFTMKANRVLGSGDLQFTAVSGDKQGKALESVSVRPASPLATTITVGRFDNKQQVVGLKRSLFAEHRNVTAGISASPLVWSEGLDSYLESYAYSCTEQLVSKGMPAIILASHQDATKRDASFNKVIQTLRERQNGDGSFGLWSANLQVEPWASVYATHYLLEAQARGYAVPADMLVSANAWLEQMAANGSQGLDGARTRAYAIYLLTKQGKVTSGLLATLQKELDERYAKVWPEDLTAAYVASSYQLLQQDDLAKRMIENVPWRKDQAMSDTESVYYDATVHDAQLLYLTAKHFKSRLSSVPKAALNSMGETISDNHFHTLSAAYLILGFDAYGVAGGSDNQFSIAEMNAAGALSSMTLNAGAVQYGKVSTKAAKVAFSKTGTPPAFYVLTETGFDSKPNEKASNEGLEIAKKLTGLDGKPLTQITVGQEFLVQLTFRSTGRDKVSQVAIVDLLPGGMEPVLKAVDASPSEDSYAEDGYAQAPAAWLSPIGEAGNSWMPDYADVRDDRVILIWHAHTRCRYFCLPCTGNQRW
jgi:alpha-2-macroglobulin